MSYTLYTDKNDKFECSLRLQGVRYGECVARLVVEADDITLLYPGKIENNGKCTIPIHNLKRVFKEQTSGNIKLEIIADDVFFTPWNSDVVIKQSKSVQVEEVEQISTPVINVQVENIKQKESPIYESEDTKEKNPTTEKAISKAATTNRSSTEKAKAYTDRIEESKDSKEPEDIQEKVKDPIKELVRKNSKRFNSVFDKYKVGE